MLKNDKKIIFCLQMLMVFVLLIFICAPALADEEKIGVIYTTDQWNSTIIEILDHEFNFEEEIRTKYPNAAYNGYSNSMIINDVLYLNPIGLIGKDDFGKIVGMDLKTKEFTEYDFDRVNITSFTVNEDMIIATSNLNARCYIDQYSKATNRIETIESEDLMFDGVAVVRDKVYSVGFDDDFNIAIYELDFLEKSII